jgi:GrpB-like predicted nucleotidyltransferase (UPF0157 family)
MLIQEYKESWSDDFNEIKQILTEALITLKISIEHVGSTSVPKLSAKPVIDIDIVYDIPVAFENIKTRLEKIGYFHNGNQGIPNREVFKRAKTDGVKGVLDEIAHHLYVCPTDSEEFKKHILFRDYLRENEEARVQYQNLKYAIAEEANQDKNKYAELKEVMAKEFIDSIVENAESKNYEKLNAL